MYPYSHLWKLIGLFCNLLIISLPLLHWFQFRSYDNLKLLHCFLPHFGLVSTNSHHHIFLLKSIPLNWINYFHLSLPKYDLYLKEALRYFPLPSCSAYFFILLWDVLPFLVFFSSVLHFFSFLLPLYSTLDLGWVLDGKLIKNFSVYGFSKCFIARFCSPLSNILSYLKYLFRNLSFLLPTLSRSEIIFQ